MEVIPNRPRSYEYVKSFEEDPRKIIRNVANICGVKPVESFSSREAKIITFDCDDVVIDLVVAEGGSTLYMYTPGLMKIDRMSIFAGTVIGFLGAFMGGYYLCNWLTAFLGGAGMYVISIWGVRNWLRQGSRVVSLVEKIKSL